MTLTKQQKLSAVAAVRSTAATDAKEKVVIPDSSVNRGIYGTEPDEVALHEKGRLPNRSVGDRIISGYGLYCFDCHTVHGANRMSGDWDTHIVREDPAGNNGSANDGISGDMSEAAKKTAFCSDCHNLNLNWDTNAADDYIPSQSYNTSNRPNLRSHVQGPAADGQMEAYHQPVTDSWASAKTGRTPQQGCRGCHSGSDFMDLEEYRATGGVSGALGDWPHQTTGSKLLFDNYNGEQLGAAEGDPQRPLSNMDEVCLDCHRNAAGTEGVGLTF